jgi:uncharacterized protein
MTCSSGFGWFLNERGRMVNARGNGLTTDRLTPLHMAAQNGNIEIVTLLLDKKATINPIDSKGWTPMDRANKWQHPDAAEFLKQHGGHEGTQK